VRDRRAERTGGRAFRVDMDPLVVAGALGEEVDLVLGDLVPAGVAQMGAHCGLEVGDAVEDPHAFGPPAT
jgi:hypothetical protein